MHELELHIPDWRHQVESAQFYTKRDMTEGTQFKVLTRIGIDCVAKIPKMDLWMKGYQKAEEIAPEHAVPFFKADNVKLSIDRMKITFPQLIIQKKTKNLLETITRAFTNKDTFLLEELVTQQATADLDMHHAGLYVPDPGYNNYGVDQTGKVKRFDFGDARDSFSSDQEYSGLMRARAETHFGIFFMLQALEKKYSLTTSEDKPFSSLYKMLIGLPDPHPRITNLNELSYLQSGKTWSPEITVFLAQVGHEEFIKNTDSVPYHLDEKFLRGLPQSAYQD